MNPATAYAVPGMLLRSIRQFGYSGIPDMFVTYWPPT